MERSRERENERGKCSENRRKPAFPRGLMGDLGQVHYCGTKETINPD